MPHFSREKFFDGIRRFLKSQGKPLAQKRVDALEFLITAFEKTLWTVPQIAYAFATIAHETAWTFEPIREYRSRAGTPGRKNQDRYWLSGYYGRGYVQLTWKRNYELFGIEDAPDKALEPATAFRILTTGMQLGSFTGKKLSDYISDTGKDYKNARKIINGLDKAQLIAKYAQSFEDILRASKTNSASAPLESPSQVQIAQNLVPSDQPPPTNSETKVEVTAEGGVKVEKSEGSPAPKERIAVVKTKPQKWHERVWTKITGAVTGNALFQWAWAQLEKIQALSVPDGVWMVVSVTIAAGSLLWIVYEIVSTWRDNSYQEAIDTLLVKENSTADNFAQLIPADEVELYRIRGFKIITRGEKA